MEERAGQDVLPGRLDGLRRVRLVDTGSVSSWAKVHLPAWAAVAAEASKPVLLVGK